MAPHADVLRVLALLLAVCEQALAELDKADSGLPPALSEQIGALRDVVRGTLASSGSSSDDAGR